GDGDAAAAAGLEVDVVYTDGEVAHALELRAGGIEELIVHTVGEHGDDDRGATDELKGLGPRQLGGRADADLGRGAGQGEGAGRQPRTDDEGRVGHCGKGRNDE